jgi:hypothetical protein
MEKQKQEFLVQKAENEKKMQELSKKKVRMRLICLENAKTQEKTEKKGLKKIVLLVF